MRVKIKGVDRRIWDKFKVFARKEKLPVQHLLNTLIINSVNDYELSKNKKDISI